MEQENLMPSDIKMVSLSGYPFGAQASNFVHLSSNDILSSDQDT